MKHLLEADIRCRPWLRSCRAGWGPFRLQGELCLQRRSTCRVSWRSLRPARAVRRGLLVLGGTLHRQLLYRSLATDPDTR